jgi:hypothetical protein
MLTNRDLYVWSSAAGLTRAATFTWRQTAQTVLDVYRRVLAS